MVHCKHKYETMKFFGPRRKTVASEYEGTYQPVHPHSMVSAFVILSLESRIT